MSLDRRIAQNMLCAHGTSFTYVGDEFFFFANKVWRDHVQQRDGLICFWCRRQLARGPASAYHARRDVPGPPEARAFHVSEARPSLEHLRPVSRGGHNSPFNMVVSCAACNHVRMNVDWRVFAQYRGGEAFYQDAVIHAQQQTYQYMSAPSAPAVWRRCALGLYRQGQHMAWGPPIDPHPGTLAHFHFVDTGFWRVPVAANGHFESLSDRRLQMARGGRDSYFRARRS